MEQRKILRTAILAEFGGEVIVKDRYTRLLELLHESLDAELDHETLWDSARNVVGETMTEELADELAWRMAGNVRRLKQRRVVSPWHVQRLPEWAPLQISACRRSKNRKGVPGATFTFRVLAGTAASLVVLHWWSLKQCRYFSLYLGFSKRPRGERLPRYPYAAPEQFVNLRLYGLLDPDLSTADGPVFQQIRLSSGVSEWNEAKLRQRCRVLPSECPAGFEPSFPCHHCDAGYVTCPAATHRKDWVKKYCETCSAAAYFDPDISLDLCVNCFRKKTYQALGVS